MVHYAKLAISTCSDKGNGMTSEMIAIQRSKIDIIWFFCLYTTALLVMLFFLTSFLFWLGLLIWLVAGCIQIYGYFFPINLSAISLITTKTSRQVNICVNHQWLDNIIINRSMMILGHLYLEFSSAHQNFNRTGVWLSRRHFVDETHRRKLLQFLILSGS